MQKIYTFKLNWRRVTQTHDSLTLSRDYNRDPNIKLEKEGDYSSEVYIRDSTLGFLEDRGLWSSVT